MQYREIPYNYSSFSDKEIVLRFLGEQVWSALESLRQGRNTGRSAKMLFEILGDMWAVERNPYLQEDLINNKKRFNNLIDAMYHRLSLIKGRTNGNEEVIKIATQVDNKIGEFSQNLLNFKQKKAKITKEFKKITSVNNIRFDPLSRASHATDATDWRVEYPILVLTPDNEVEVAKMVKACAKLGLNLIARGGGTGYTGSCVPLTKNSVVLNTEKLKSISAIYDFNTQPIIRVGSGVVTKEVAGAAAKKNLIFAVDPTSQDSCTIGGNIAMNAGGKKALRWGTTIDNLLSWRLVNNAGDILEVRRLNPNFDKIQLLETIEFSITNLSTKHTQNLKIATADIRKRRLGKDVTNKFMQGLPGVQKEGCDGIITSAEFILHKPLSNIYTLCLEFFGFDTEGAVASIIKIKDLVDNNPAVDLVGMEHLDYRYIKAVRYSTKANRFGLPRMLLLIDIASNDTNLLDTEAESIGQIIQDLDAEIFIAKDNQKRQEFWQDRANTAAIAAHTNAFKINEDVVLPLENLAKYSDEIERINMQLSIENKLLVAKSIKDYLNSQNINKLATSNELLDKVIRHWQYNLDSLEGDETFRKIQIADLVISYHSELEQPLFNLLSGDSFKQIRDKIMQIHKNILGIRLFVALHMHAGDGNVHTNIPVHSYSKEMLAKADEVVDKIMALATSLGGVISGEHGIGLTKYEYLSDEFKDDFAKYKQQIDPNNLFNAGKLMPGSTLDKAYTPSLELLEQEALILENSEIGHINEMTKSCLRCGKCKSVCTTHVPEQNLLYSPRDKIIGSNLLIEAFLYEEQTRRGIALNHFAEFDDLSDHCTVCHLCKNPCPVDIDFGDVSIKMREILINKQQKDINLASKLAMGFLNLNTNFANHLSKKFLNLGYASQRLGTKLFKPFNKEVANLTVKKPSAFKNLTTLLDKPLPTDSNIKPLRELLNLSDNSKIPVLEPKDAIATVFYFPGCGSEKLFSQISLATLAILYQHKIRVVLPNSYLCCGYPQAASGDTKLASKIITDNKVLMHRIANTLNYLDVSHILTSCGTCIDKLAEYKLTKIFESSSLVDIHEYLLNNNIKLAGSSEKYLYHAPCHNPIKNQDENIISEFMGADILKSDRCCGESGTFASSRPDIAKAVKGKKLATIEQNLVDLDHNNQNGVKMLTTCPACRQGLSRYENETGVQAIYPIEIMAENLLGTNWMQDFIDNANIEQVLL
jgi:FAD/FMN-containing dehydrogenase/Fe-S oxidoreductase